MKSIVHYSFLVIGLSISFMATAQLSEESQLYKTMVKMDDTYFTAYNECDMDTQASLYSENLEFYHDMGGLSTSKKEILKSIEENICGKVTRELVEGSVEVHEIPGFGAVMIGMHKFHNNQEPGAESKPSRFITVWKNENSNWKISRVISLHKN